MRSVAQFADIHPRSATDVFQPFEGDNITVAIYNIDLFQIL